MCKWHSLLLLPDELGLRIVLPPIVLGFPDEPAFLTEAHKLLFPEETGTQGSL